LLYTNNAVYVYIPV